MDPFTFLDDPKRYVCKVSATAKKTYLRDDKPVPVRDIPKEILKQIPTPPLDPSFHDISNYSVSHTNGRLTYTFQGKKIAIKNIPKEIKQKLGRPLPPKEWANGIHYENYEGFSYLHSFGRKHYYYYGHNILKSQVPKEFLDKVPNMFPDRNYSWYSYKEKTKEESTEEKRQDRAEESATEEEKIYEVPSDVPSNYATLSPFQLLKSCGIYDRKSWHKWMLQNHPDKRPNIDPMLVALVNHAIDVSYPR